MDRLVQSLARLFSAHGHTVTEDAALEGRSGTIYTAPLLAEQDGHAVVIDLRGPEEIVDGAAVQELCSVIEDVGADIGVLVHLEEPAPDASAHNDGSLVLWSTATLQELLGNLAMYEACDAPLGDLPLTAPEPPQATVELPASLDDLLPDAFHGEGLDLEAVEEMDYDFGIDTIGDAPATAEAAPTQDDVQAVPEPTAPLIPQPTWASHPGADALIVETPRRKAADPAVATPDPAGPAEAGPRTFTYPILPVHVSADQAARQARDRLFNVKGTRLLLHPVHLYDYECDLLTGGSLRYETVSGRVQVDGTRRGAEEVDPRVVTLGEPVGADSSLEVEERPLRVDADKAEALVHEVVTKAHTRLVAVEVRNEEASYAYAEKHKVAPRSEHVRLEHVGVFHRAIWRVWGPNGHVDIDGMTGAVVDASLRNPNPDIIVMD